MMKKTIFVFCLSVLALIYGKYDLSLNAQVYNNYLPKPYTAHKITSQEKKSLVQMKKAGMTQMKFIHLQKTLGKIDIATYAIVSDTPIVLVETLDYNINVKGFNKMIDNFSSLYSTDNKALMRNYQDYADRNCQKIYGCVGSVENNNCDWKIIKFLPNPEICDLEPTITMSNVMLYK